MELSKKLGRIAAATLSTSLLFLAVAKGQGCQRSDGTPETVTTAPPAEPDVSNPSPTQDVGGTGEDAGAQKALPEVIPATKSGIFLELEPSDDEHPLMGASKSAGFLPRNNPGVGLGGLGGTSSGGGFGNVGKPTQPQPAPVPQQNAQPQVRQ